MKDNPPVNYSEQMSRTILERDHACGQSREQSKERWGAIFNDAIWDDIIKKPNLVKTFSSPPLKREPFKPQSKKTLI